MPQSLLLDFSHGGQPALRTSERTNGAARLANQPTNPNKIGTCEGCFDANTNRNARHDPLTNESRSVTVRFLHQPEAEQRARISGSRSSSRLSSSSRPERQVLAGLFFSSRVLLTRRDPIWSNPSVIGNRHRGCFLCDFSVDLDRPVVSGWSELSCGLAARQRGRKSTREGASGYPQGGTSGTGRRGKAGKLTVEQKARDPVIGRGEGNAKTKRLRRKTSRGRDCGGGGGRREITSFGS